MKKEEYQSLEKMASHVLNLAKNSGAKEAAITLKMAKGLSTTVRLGSVETVEFNQGKALGLTVYKGKKKGSVTTTDFNEAALETLVKKACYIADITEEDDAQGLPDPKDLATHIKELDLFHLKEIQVEESIEWAKNCEEAARAFDKRIINSEGASFSNTSKFKVYADSQGFLGSYPSTLYSMSCVVLGQGKDGMQRDHDFTVARDFNQLTAFEKVGLGAGTRTIQRLDARKINTCECPVIFAANIATSLWSHLIAAISGSSLYRKSSFLLDHLGQNIFPNFVQVLEEPHILGGLGSAPFDEEGVSNYPHAIVEAGRLESYVLGSYSARKLGLKTTGNCGGVHNLIVSHGEKDLSMLLKKMHRGLLVTELMGHGINIITGDYSRGAFGFWVENGEIQYPVQEITIAGNLKEMFSNIVEIGNDIEKRGNIQTGSVLLERMTVAGN